MIMDERGLLVGWEMAVKCLQFRKALTNWGPAEISCQTSASSAARLFQNFGTANFSLFLGLSTVCGLD